MHLLFPSRLFLEGTRHLPFTSYYRPRHSRTAIIQPHWQPMPSQIILNRMQVALFRDNYHIPLLPDSISTIVFAADPLHIRTTYLPSIQEHNKILVNGTACLYTTHFIFSSVGVELYKKDPTYNIVVPMLGIRNY